MRVSFLRSQPSFFIALVVLVVTAIPAFGEEESFLELRGLAPIPLKSTATLESWDVSVDVGPFARGAQAVAVDLPDGLRHRVEGYEVEFRGVGDLAWRGRFADGGQVILTLKEGLLVGLLFAPDAVYELTTSERGQILQRLDPEGFSPCAHEDGADHGLVRADLYGFDPGLAPPTPTPTLDALTDDQIINIDVMSVYTVAARNGAGGTAQIQATAQSAVDVSNTAFANSDNAVRFTLAHTAQVNYTETGNIAAARNWARNNPTVNALRDEHAADLVGMLVENGGGFCGIAFLMGHQNPATFAANAYQVTARTCAVGNLSYPHEHGHNMGLQHDPANGAPPSQAVYPWSYGHFHNGNYRTVMSYSNQCPSGCIRRPYFSNPNIIFQGAPTGIANERDNSRTIGLVAPFTAAYRTLGGGGGPCDGVDCPPHD